MQKTIIKTVRTFHPLGKYVIHVFASTVFSFALLACIAGASCLLYGMQFYQITHSRTFTVLSFFIMAACFIFTGDTVWSKNQNKMPTISKQALREIVSKHSSKN